MAYHNYALAPLVMMAELSRLDHDNWYLRRHGRLQSWQRVLDGIADPAWFVQKTGVAQKYRRRIFGWIVPHRDRPELTAPSQALMTQAPFRYASWAAISASSPTSISSSSNRNRPRLANAAASFHPLGIPPASPPELHGGRGSDTARPGRMPAPPDPRRTKR